MLILACPFILTLNVIETTRGSENTPTLRQCNDLSQKSSTEYADFELIRFLFLFQDKTLSFIKSEEKLDHILDKVR